MTEPERPVAVAVVEASHSLGFHLEQCRVQLARIADLLERIANLIEQS